MDIDFVIAPGTAQSTTSRFVKFNSVFNCPRYHNRIKADIRRAENWTRRAMMYVMIGIGGRSATLRKAAEAAIRRIGPVAFDPGNTACEFPDALPHIAKMWERKKR